MEYPKRDEKEIRFSEAVLKNHLSKDDDDTELKKETTVVLIAHRLSSTRSMDKIVYLESGKVVAMGTFADVRKAVPDFDKQASLMGL